MKIQSTSIQYWCRCCNFIYHFMRMTTCVTPMKNAKSIKAMNLKRVKVTQVLQGGNLWWKSHRASEGHQRRNHYANSPPLCLTSNNTALYIYKAWQDTVHTALLSKRSHARVVTPNGWPLSARRLLGQTPHFTPAGTHTHTQTPAKSPHAAQGSHHISRVKSSHVAGG